MNPFRTRPRGPLSLQTRLMAAVTGFVSLILVVIAIATSVVLGNVLNGRLQDELAATAKGVGGIARQSAVIGHFVPNASDLVVGPTGVPNGTLVIVVSQTGAATGTVVTSDRVAQDLTALQIHQVVTALSEGRYAEDLSQLGDYQFVHQPVPPTGPTQFEVITGLPRASTEAQITTLFSMIALTTIGGLILLALSTAITIRVALRPLREVAATANRVANQPLDRGDVSITERVPAAEADPRTETGLVGSALNTLLDHVDASLAVRQRNEERMRQFVADASHELRTPLSSIRGYSELSLRALSKSDAPEDAATASAHTALERIQAQSLRMTSLVEDLLLLARLEEGRELSLSTVDLSRLAIEGVEDARPTAPDHDWAIDVPEEPVELIGDTGRLQQVVTNLLANARTHTPAGTQITIEVAEEGHEAVLRVCDDGPGIDPAVRDELFSRFARGDRSRNRATGGSGLGLSITKAIVDGHGGTISVQSEPGATLFTVRLPRVPHPQTGSTPSGTKPSGTPSTGPAPSTPSGSADSSPDGDSGRGGHEMTRTLGGH
ncbi:ATP-binding protein [Microbacterium sp. Au-Mic1]|uniref:ATP-binding protein n=1 Tax=Microbacterium sp. Au-Mic1 TaxID=2906457 RepID=UPI001E3A3B91|nr:ATP-binding protein [Microbacterium sp. Au-Mic1]MCE4025630.1 ATP-binding protein [Microbacterium sp. Au-Mic1]